MPALLAQRLEQKRLDYNVVNASISGETTSGGRARLAAALDKYAPAIVIIALGANDGLRGLPIPTMRDNLAAMTASAQGKKGRVLIVGQRLPPNYGPYAVQFHNVFGEVAKSRKRRSSTSCSTASPISPQFFQADNLPDGRAQPRCSTMYGLASKRC